MFSLASNKLSVLKIKRNKFVEILVFHINIFARGISKQLY